MTAEEAIRRFNAFAILDWHRLGSAGGYSGAELWRGEVGGIPIAVLKRWPVGYSAERLTQVHRWMKAAEGLSFVPRVIEADDGETVLQDHGPVWDVVFWKPGEPEHARPFSKAKLHAAAVAIQLLHLEWAREGTEPAPIPGILRRLSLFDEWRAEPARNEDGIWREAASLARAAIPSLVYELRVWLATPLPLHPCLTDCHADHILYTGDAVHGVIDYGAMKVDHPAVDAARFLGDATDGDERSFLLGCDLFADVAPAGLIDVLDRSGTVGGIVHWLRGTDRSPTAEARLTKLVSRWRKIADRRVE